MFYYLKSAFGCLLITVCFLYACQPNAVVPALPPYHVALIARESVATSAGITLSADSVNVSICPTGSACFAPNSASVKLQLKKNAQSRSVRLWTFIPNYQRRPSATPLSDSVSVEFDGQLYKVILRDGDYRKGPESTVLPEVVIQVSRL